MNKKIMSFVLFLLLIFTFGCLSQENTNEIKDSKEKKAVKNGAITYVEDELIFALKDGVELEDVLKVISNKSRTGKSEVLKVNKIFKTNSSVLKRASSKNNKEKKLSKAAKTLENSYKIKLENKDLEEKINLLIKSGLVEYAHKNYYFKPFYQPNDKYFSLKGSWGQSFDDMFGLKKMGLPYVWDITKGENIIVAVVDTGVDYTHPDIANNIWRDSTGAAGYNFCRDDEGNPYNGFEDGMDDAGHGTHVAGTIAAVGNNDIGVIGVAPRSKIMPVKVLGAGGSTTEIIVQGIKYAVDNGANVINMSLGGKAETNVAEMDVAIQYAYENNVVVVVAAGNDNDDTANYSPAHSDHVINVAAVDYKDEAASFTNYGEKVDVSAPGVAILSLRKELNKYSIMDGTSMAAPHISGVVALILSENPDYNPDDVETLIKSSVDTTVSNKLIGTGRINVSKVFQNNAVVSIHYKTNLDVDLYYKDINNMWISVDATNSYISDEYKNFKINSTGLEFYFTDDSSKIYTINGVGEFIVDGAVSSYSLDVVKNPMKILNIIGGLDNDYSVQTIKLDDGFLLFGHSSSAEIDLLGAAGESDYYISKVDNDFNIISQKLYGSEYNDYLVDAKKADDNSGFFLFGNRYDANFKEIPNVIKLDNDLNVVWDKTYENLKNMYFKIDGVTETNNGDILLYSYSNNLLKIDIDGFLLDDFSLPVSSDYGAIKDLKPTSDGGYILAGKISTSLSAYSDDDDFYVVKFDNDFNIIWEDRNNLYVYDKINEIIETKDKGFLYVGYTSKYYSPLSGVTYKKIYVVKMNKNGNIEWQNMYGGAYSQEAKYAFETKDGGYVIAGQNNSIYDDMNVDFTYDNYYFLKIDSVGEIEAEAMAGGDYPEILTNVLKLSDDEFLFGGYSYSNFLADDLEEEKFVGQNYGGTDIYLQKFKVSESLIQEKIKVHYKTDWENAHIHYKKEGSSWTKAPGIKLGISDLGVAYKSIVIPASSLEFVFNDGGSNWDNNSNNNFLITDPGEYVIENGSIRKLTDKEYFVEAPTNLRINQVASSYDIYIQWDTNETAAGYKVFMSEEENGLYEEVGETANYYFYKISNFGHDRLYFKVFAYKGDSLSQASNTLRVDLPGFQNPSLTIVEYTFEKTIIDWDPIDGANVYLILKDGEILKETSETELIDYDVKSNEEIHYQVQAKGEFTTSGFAGTYVRTPEREKVVGKIEISISEPELEGEQLLINSVDYQIISGKVIIENPYIDTYIATLDIEIASKKYTGSLEFEITADQPNYISEMKIIQVENIDTLYPEGVFLRGSFNGWLEPGGLELELVENYIRQIDVEFLNDPNNSDDDNPRFKISLDYNGWSNCIPENGDKYITEGFGKYRIKFNENNNNIDIVKAPEWNDGEVWITINPTTIPSDLKLNVKRGSILYKQVQLVEGEYGDKFAIVSGLEEGTYTISLDERLEGYNYKGEIIVSISKELSNLELTMNVEITEITDFSTNYANGIFYRGTSNSWPEPGGAVMELVDDYVREIEVEFLSNGDVNPRFKISLELNGWNNCEPQNGDYFITEGFGKYKIRFYEQISGVDRIEVIKIN